MPFISPRSDWATYKRYSDNTKVEARLVAIGEEKYMQVKESRGDKLICPHCNTLLSLFGGKQVGPLYLDPVAFHERHRPVN